MLKLIKIAVTGGIASGKTSFCRILEDLGAFYVSSDEIVHKILLENSTIKKKIIDFLGIDILVKNKIDKKKIANIVFNDKKKLKKLEKIIHPTVSLEINNLFEKLKKNNNYNLFVVEEPLLFEAKHEKNYDFIITIVSSNEICEKRIKNKKNYLNLKKRMERQISIEKKAKKSDFIIHNNKGLKDLKEKAIKLKQIIQTI